MQVASENTNAIDARKNFQTTKEYKRFVEFCDACRRERYIGLCYGLPGVGKTVSARHYARWHWFDDITQRSWSWKCRMKERAVLPDEALSCFAVFYTAEVAGNAKRLELQLTRVMDGFDDAIEDAIDARTTDDRLLSDYIEHTELLIVDEADRLKLQSLEQLRDIFDRKTAGLVLLGMPGMEKRLSRYPQLYSRVGFVHEFKALSQEEMVFMLEHKYAELGITLKIDEFMDFESISSVARITQGNFRLLQRLLAQIERLLKINDLKIVTKELVEAARENLVIGVA